MSLFNPASVTCPRCGTEAALSWNASVNAVRAPHLRVAILDGSFQAAACKGCGTALRLPPHLTYLDISRGSWLLVEPAEMLEQWPEVEMDGFRVFLEAFGETASPAAQEIGAGLRPRLVFGWAALREKLICEDLGLDDTTLELLKMAIMRDVDRPPAADQTELRLVGGDAGTLNFEWIETESESTIAGLAVPRDVYDDIVASPEPWSIARGKFERVLLVDLRRLLAGATTR